MIDKPVRRFVENVVLPWIEDRKQELANRPLIRKQAFGEALDPDRLERPGRYELWYRQPMRLFA